MMLNSYFHSPTLTPHPPFFHRYLFMTFSLTPFSSPLHHYFMYSGLSFFSINTIHVQLFLQLKNMQSLNMPTCGQYSYLVPFNLLCRKNRCGCVLLSIHKPELLLLYGMQALSRLAGKDGFIRKRKACCGRSEHEYNAWLK